MTQQRLPIAARICPRTLSASNAFILLFLFCSLLLMGTGCSSLPRNAEGRILVDVVTNPPGATFLGPGRVPHTTPAQIAIRDDHALSIVLTKEGYEPEQIKIGPRSRPNNLDTPPDPASGYVTDLASLVREISREFSGANGVLEMSPNPVNVDLTPSDGSLPRYPDDPPAVEAREVSCESPVVLTKDCSGTKRGLPTRRLHVRGLNVRVAGSFSGEEVLVMHDDLHPVILGLYPQGPGPDACTRVLRQILEYGAKFRSLAAVKSGSATHGCFLEFSENVYDSLKSLTIAE